jgi:pimeloyl-ACP methyl ester carboxylesterase
MTVKIVRHEAGTAPRGVVLMLHGGGEDPEAHPVGDLHLGYARMVFLHWCIKRELASRGVSLWLVRDRFTSWNAPTEDGGLAPVADARTGLEAIRSAHGEDLPVVLVGHSMGARAALHVVDHPMVVGMVAVAPWLPPEEPVDRLENRHLAAAVSGADTQVDLVDVRAFVARAELVARSAVFEQIGNRGPGELAHGMGHNVGEWHGFIIRNAVRMISDDRTSDQER